MISVPPLLVAVFIASFGVEASAQEDSDKRAPEPRWIAAEKAPKWLITGAHFIDEKTGWIVGTVGEVASTSDGGRTWTQLKGQGKQESWRTVWFLDADHGFMAGGLASPHEDFIPPKIYRTNDGGRGWEDITPAPIRGKMHAAFDGLRFFSAKEGLLFGDRLFATKDGGETWSATGNEETVHAHGSSFISPKVGWALRTDVWKTSDGGGTWKLSPALAALTEDERVHSALDQVYFRNESHGGLVTAWGTFLRTDDGGTSWQVVGKVGRGVVRRLVLTDFLRGWAILEASADEKHLIMGTTDGGKTWKESFRSDRRLWDFHFLGRDLGWAVGDATVVRLTSR